MTTATMPYPLFEELLKHMLWRPRSSALAAPPRDAVADFHGESMRQVEEARRDLEAWAEEGQRLRPQLWEAVVKRRGAWSPQDLDAVIDAYEADFEREAADIGRLEKSYRRHRKRMAASNPEGANTIKELDDSIIALMRFELETRMEMALFLRALRSEIDPRARGGPVFDNSEALDRYLAAATD